MTSKENLPDGWEAVIRDGVEGVTVSRNKAKGMWVFTVRTPPGYRHPITDEKQETLTAIATDGQMDVLVSGVLNVALEQLAQEGDRTAASISDLLKWQAQINEKTE